MATVQLTVTTNTNTVNLSVQKYTPIAPSSDIFSDYTDTTAMLSDQANQADQVVYAVADASDDPNITFPSGETRLQAYYRYLGTTAGTMADYELISAPYAKKTSTGGYSITSNQAAQELYLKDIDGNTISTISVAFLNNEGTTFFYNEVTEKLELKNDAGDVLSEIPVSAFVSNLAVSLELTGSELKLKDTEGNVLSTVTLTKSAVGLGNVDNTSDMNKPVSTAQAAALAEKVDKVAGKGLSTNDYTTTEKNKLSGIEAGAQANVKPDWTATTGTTQEILNKPTQVNFNIYNQNKTNKRVISTTSKSSIVTATTGAKALPSYALNDSFIGRAFGFFDNAGSARTIQVFFNIGNREYSTSITATETGIVPFQIEYIINFPVYREANISGIIRLGVVAKEIDLDFAIITGLDFDIQTTLSGGTLTLNSSYLHRNYNG